MKRRTYAPRIRDNIAEHGQKHSVKKESEQHESTDVHLHQQGAMIQSDTASHIQRQRETKKYQSKDVRIHADLPKIYQDTETDREKERQKKTQTKRGIYTRTISDNIAEHRQRH